MVEIHAASSSRARSWRPSSCRRFRIRPRSSPAARSVYVMTRIESTSSPRSQTARQKRSTMTVVLPVPAPAETKTTPGSSIARSCSVFGPASTTLTALRLDPVAPGQRRRRPSRQSRLGLRTTSQATSSGPPHPAHRPRVAPGRAREAALRVVAHGALADPRDGRARLLLRPLDLAPEPLLVDVVVAHVAGHAVLLRLGPQEPAREALAGKRAVDAAERLDPDQVAENEHVERDLQVQLVLDPTRRVGGLARLVVDDDTSRAERVAVDPVDLPRDREAAEIEPALQLLCRALVPERDLEAVREKRRRRLGLLPDELLQVAREALLELAPLE